jgi:hypothetical protein
MTWMEFALKAMPVLFTLVNGLFVFINWKIAGALVARPELEKLSMRVLVLEKGPDWGLMNEIRGQLSSITREIGTLMERSAGQTTNQEKIEHRLDRIEQHLLENKL